MSDLLAVILYVMEDDADAFWCFSGCMDMMVRTPCTDFILILLTFHFVCFPNFSCICSFSLFVLSASLPFSLFILSSSLPFSLFVLSPSLPSSLPICSFSLPPFLSLSPIIINSWAILNWSRLAFRNNWLIWVILLSLLTHVCTLILVLSVTSWCLCFSPRSFFSESNGSSNFYFAFRWLLVNFKREFTFDETMRLWEVLNKHASYSHSFTDTIKIYVFFLDSVDALLVRTLPAVLCRCNH